MVQNRIVVKHVSNPENHDIKDISIIRKVHISMYECFLHQNISTETTHSVYGTTPVWCKGGSRYVEGSYVLYYINIIYYYLSPGRSYVLY